MQLFLHSLFLFAEKARERVLTIRDVMCYNKLKYGPVAQLGERRVRNAEAEGSIPFGSTKE